MKAVVYEKYASHGGFIFREVEKPVPDDNEVLIRIIAASVNALDYRQVRMGIVPKGKILGADIAGRVEEVGKNIREFQPGDEVLGEISDCGSGGFSEYVTVIEKVLVHKPAGVSFEEAAAVPVAALTALQALRDKGNIQSGQKVLINGAGGGVGTFAVQFAKYYGAEVTAVCSTGNTELARSLGADNVIDYTQEDFTKSGNRYDIIIAVNGYHPLLAYMRALTSRGIYVMVGGTWSQIFKSLVFGPLMSIGSRKFRILAAKCNKKDLAFIIDLVKKGEVKPFIDRRYPLSETGEAFRYLNEGHARGKVVITVSGENKTSI